MATHFISIETMLAIEDKELGKPEDVREVALKQIKERCEKALTGDADAIILHIETEE
jgi:hypothetical protein